MKDWINTSRLLALLEKWHPKHFHWRFGFHVGKTYYYDLHMIYIFTGMLLAAEILMDLRFKFPYRSRGCSTGVKEKNFIKCFILKMLWWIRQAFTSLAGPCLVPGSYKILWFFQYFLFFLDTNKIVLDVSAIFLSCVHTVSE